MVFIIGASSLKAGIQSTSATQQKELSPISFSAKGLSLNPNSITPVLDLGFLLRRGKLKSKANIVLWHDVISNTITEHRLNNYKAETVDSLISTLRNFSHRIAAITYCQRQGTPYIFEELLSTGILVIPAAKKLISSRNQKDWWHQVNLGEVHPAKSLERRFIKTILRKSNNLQSIVIRKRRANRKRPSKKRSQRKGKPRKRSSKKKSK